MKKSDFDMIIIGGGATGAGIALDASSRGLQVALFEQNDFGEGTSSRSTKLVHGGVRYLEDAIKHLNKAQYALVKEGLRERKIFLENASHLAHPIELITPIYKWIDIPYIYSGLWLYDRLSGKYSLGKSRLISASKAIQINPSINPHGLKAAVSYCDGAFNDSRMVIALIQSAQENGAMVRNHHKITKLHKKSGKLHGVTVVDQIKQKEYQYSADIIINAAGPFVDQVRKLDDPNSKPILQISSGIHLVVDRKFLPSPKGIMIPKTSDGRVIFILPYQDKCIIGTSDNPATVSQHPKVSKSEIDYLLANINKYLNIHIKKSDILSSFSGLRPLLAHGDTNNTSRLVREHIEIFSDSGLLTVAGGKWTSYRRMSQSAVNLALKTLGKNLNDYPCTTKHYKLVGSRKPIPDTIPKELTSRYGDQATKIAQISANLDDDGELPRMTRAELIYTISSEYVKKPLDFLVRRTSIAMTDTHEALKLLPKLANTMKYELGYSDELYEELEKEAFDILKSGI